MSTIQEIVGALTPQQLARLMSNETIDTIATFGFADENNRIIGTPPAPAPTSIVPQSLKVLNGFMAFRSYYSSIFDGHQLPQRARSALVKTLWDHEHEKIEWALIGKAYSGLRDQVGKTLAPLRAFLRYACPAMNMVDPSAYLKAHNWIMQLDANGDVVLTQTSAPLVARREDCETEHGLMEKIHNNGYRLTNGDTLSQHQQSRAFQVMTVPSTATTRVPDNAGLIRLIRDIRTNSQEAVHRALGTTPGAHLGYNYMVHWLRDPQVDGHNDDDMDVDPVPTTNYYGYLNALGGGQ